MNRKQRRASGRQGAAAASKPGASPRGAAVADIFAAAIANHRAGSFAEAERHYRHVLAVDSNHAEAHSRIGAVLMAQGKIRQAISHLERAVALKPDLFEALGNLAQAYLASGQRAEAVLAALAALELRETAPGKVLFAHCAHNAVFKADPDGRARKLMLRALLEDWAPPRELTGAVISLIKLNGAANDCVERINSARPARLAAADLLGLPGLAELLNDRLLHALLIRDPVTDIGLERLLTSVRHTMLTIAAGQGAWDESLLDFFCALARQCFLNEYVYELAESEAAETQALRSALIDKLAAGERIPALLLVTVAAYFPLHGLPNAEALMGLTWPQAIDDLIVQQIEEPAQERQIAATLPALTRIEDAVSQAVRLQYEENPYPRWVRTAPPEKPSGLGRQPPGPVADLLIAGCGTGLSLVELARSSAKARIVAVDLSRTSLAYAKRMALKLGLADIEFAQADILELGSIARQFDFIDASGVLHHLADPWQGWRVLLSLLRPGGTMQVGLYSDVARRNVVAARALIAERGYRPVAQDIRRCRGDIIGSQNPPLKSLVRSQDFFTTSECRDFLFHVQEVRITLPEIKSFLAANHLRFGGFHLDPLTLQKFIARFPARAALTDLDCWQAYETDAPETFAGMYQFQVQKPPR
ncbi:MAG TPA: methyltransferase domain-containing protein [Xanthobacteraceae bacterium]|nr:methyltransferase domain-containing protein [Xanthobacteraceae bacterium]